MNKKRIGCVVVILFWIVCSVVLKLIGPGVFKGMEVLYSVGETYDKYDELLEDVLDFATAPLQLACFGAYCLYENSDGRVREKKEEQAAYDRKQAERLSYLSLLEEDDERMFTEPDFLCPTNRMALEVLNGWILLRQSDRNWCKSTLPRCAEHALAS